MMQSIAAKSEPEKDNGIKSSRQALLAQMAVAWNILGLLIPVSFALFTSTVLADEWATALIPTTITPATRMEHRQQRTEANQTAWHTQLTGEHRWYNWAAVWQLQHQQRLDTDGSRTERQLAELSWNPALNDQLSLRIGKFSQDIERSTLFQPLGFFQTPAAPFDSFASIEGVWMASLTWWIQDSDGNQQPSWLDGWIIMPIIARNAPEQFPATTAQRLPNQERSPHQWGLVLERDFDSLSTTLLAQQFQGQKAGLGFGYSWVSGTSWQFSGSGFVREGSRYLAGYNRASGALNHTVEQLQASAPALPNSTSTDTPSPYRSQQRGYFSRLSQGIQWSGLSQTLMLELHYDRRKLTRREQKALYQNTDSASSTASSTPMTQEVATALGNLGDAIRLLSEDRYQQRYLYGNYRWEDTEQQWSASLLLGADHSHWSQIRYTRHINWSLSLWAEMDRFSGNDSTEFGRVPWQSIYRLGGQWVF